MNLIFKFKYSYLGDLAFENVFKPYYNWFIEQHPEINVTVKDVTPLAPVYNGSNDSGFFLTITNPKTKKYIVVSYWDDVQDLLNSGLGWDHENCVDLITSCGINHFGFLRKDPINYTPFSYTVSQKSFETISEQNFIPFENKQNCNLFFRGLPYGLRKEFNKLHPKIITEVKISLEDYLYELSNNKINLSLNGVAEICYRDIEILSTSSVLLRPKLNVNFHNELIPWKHYIPFDLNSNDSIENQWKIIKETFDSVKNNNILLSEISKNGYMWYKENGTIEANINLLKKLINIKKLF